MSSDDEYAGDLNYGIDDNYSEAFSKSNGLNIDDGKKIAFFFVKSYKFIFQ